MNNFSFLTLVLIDPRLSIQDPQIKKFAPHSFSIIEKSTTVASLEDISREFDVIIGFSRRSGQFRRKDIELPELPQFINKKISSSYNIAFLFGNEQVGLSEKEMQLCHYQCSIPTTGNLESLNLAQAVALVLYECSKLSPTSDTASSLPKKSINSLVNLLDTTKYFKQEEKKVLFIPYLSKLLSRGINNKKDDIVLSNLFKRLEGIFMKKKK